MPFMTLLERIDKTLDIIEKRAEIIKNKTKECRKTKDLEEFIDGLKYIKGQAFMIMKIIEKIEKLLE